MKNIVVTGSLAFDYIMDFPGKFEEHILPEKLKTLSVSFLLKNLNKNFGGTAGNIAYTLALLKTPTTLLGSLGKKDSPEYVSHLNKAGINTDHMQIIDDEYTATAYIMTDKNNCQITGFYQGAMQKDSNLTLDVIKDSPSMIVVSPTEVKAMENFVNQARIKELPYLFDPAQRIGALPKNQLLTGIDGAEIVIGNDYEITLIMEKTNVTKKDILAKAKILITTLGQQGSLIETKGEQITVGIVKPKAIVDPTGAGDAYIAGFAAGYVNNLPLKTCGQMGATAATYAIEQYGTQNHTFTIDEFKERYSKAFGEMVKW